MTNPTRRAPAKFGTHLHQLARDPVLRAALDRSSLRYGNEFIIPHPGVPLPPMHEMARINISLARTAAERDRIDKANIDIAIRAIKRETIRIYFSRR